MKSIAIMAAMSSLFVSPPFTAGHTQDKNEIPTQPHYSQVIERAFQFSQGIPVDFKGIEYKVVVRYLPSSNWPESQLVFVEDNNHAIRVTEYRLTEGTRPISETYNETLHQNPQATIEDILKRVSIEKVERAGDKSAKGLVDQLFALSIPTKMSSDLCMDGTTYELWVLTPSNEIHASLSDCSYGSKTPSIPIIHWLKAVQTEFVRQQQLKRINK
jgi:hypothetical protein